MEAIRGKMNVAESSTPALFIRIFAVIIVVSLYQYWPLLSTGISLFEQLIYNFKYQEVTWIEITYATLGSVYILNWFLGLITAFSLFRLKPVSRWLLLAYFLLGLAGISVSWIPYSGMLMSLFDNPYLKLLAIQLPNIIIVIAVFILFRKTPYSESVLEQN
jgi:hypothetical protein